MVVTVRRACQGVGGPENSAEQWCGQQMPRAISACRTVGERKVDGLQARSSALRPRAAESTSSTNGCQAQRSKVAASREYAWFGPVFVSAYSRAHGRSIGGRSSRSPIPPDREGGNGGNFYAVKKSMSSRAIYSGAFSVGMRPAFGMRISVVCGTSEANRSAYSTISKASSSPQISNLGVVDCRSAGTRSRV